MTGRHLTPLLVALAVLVATAAVSIASLTQRSASRTAYEQAGTGQALLTAMLDQETGVRGLAISGDEAFLDPFRHGRREYAAAFAGARRQVAGDTYAAAALSDADGKARAWGRLADLAIVQLRRGERERALGRSQQRRRKSLMEGFRTANARYRALVAPRGKRLETRALMVLVLLVFGLGALFAAAGAWLSRRLTAARAAAKAAEDAFAGRQRDLNLALQVTESEEEAHAFLQRHLRSSVPGSEVVVLKRNNSQNRLLPATALTAESKLRDALLDAEPRTCLAIRLAQPRTGLPPGSDSVLTCSICSRLESETVCSPLLVAGEVIGSVLVGHPGPLSTTDERAIEESVKQAAPVLANLRNLAIAENRAATDGLTGLPNRRAFEESLRRMVAHSNRSMSPLAAVALDLDHFKQINDVHGHARGDQVLAEVGALLQSLLRDSDLVARVGGEEFMLLLPDTGRDGAIVICERVRASVAALEFHAMPEGVSASLGIATLPEDGTEGGTLVRTADRMLYAAKDLGRNRVEITELVLGPLPDEVTG